MEIKVYSPREYSKEVKVNGKQVTEKTVIRRCQNNQLPTMTAAHKVGRTWIIFVGF